MDKDLLLSFERLEREHWWFVVRRRLVLDTIRTSLPPNVERIVEVGCGTGGLLGDLERLYPDAAVQGIEPSGEAAAAARSSGCEVTEAFFEELPLEDDCADLLIALDVLEHCPDDGVSAAEAYRVLRPGGMFVATVPALPSMWGPHDDLNAHQRRYVRDTLREPLEAAGLRIERMTYFNTVLLPVGYAGRVVSRATHSTVGTGISMPPRPLNALLRGIFGTEVRLARHMDLPIGISLLAVCGKPVA